jgi:hypothetical protein
MLPPLKGFNPDQIIFIGILAALILGVALFRLY